MKAELIQSMGTDLTVVDAARVSFDKQSEWGFKYETLVDCVDWMGQPIERCVKDLKEEDKRLVKYLASHDHYTPFTHCAVTMRETVPIFVARQRFKHMVGFSYNEVSRRYVDDTPEFWSPDEWRSRALNKKQGSDGPLCEDAQRLVNEEHEAFLKCALQSYEYKLSMGVAPEQARADLPQSMYTSYYVTGSLAAWARAYNLRIDPHAQKEIQDLATMWGEIIAPLFPNAWKALTL